MNHETSQPTGRRPGWHVSRLTMTLLCAASLAACASSQEIIGAKEDHLAAAGFVQQPANTPDRAVMLHRLPAHHFVRRIKNDMVSYVYADPSVCGCLYVGSQDAYGRYRLYQQQQNLADEQAMTASEYNDPAWNWGMWGPGFGPGFVYGPGPGW